MPVRSPVASNKITVTPLSSSGRKRTAPANSAPSFLLWVMLLLVVGVFIMIGYVAHWQLGQEFDSTKAFVFNKLHKFEEALNKSLNDVPLSDNQLTVNIPLHLTKKIDSSKEAPLSQRPGSSNSQHSSDFDLSVQLKPEQFENHRLTCPYGDKVTFWKKPTESDLRYRTPFLKHPPRIKYVTFEPDVGGWNNIRMQMELVLVFAYATGRTFVMPPDQPMYLLNQGKGHQKAHGFIDFFPFDHIKKRMEVISMEEFLAREGVTGHLRNQETHRVQYPPGNKTVFVATQRDERLSMWEYLRKVASCPKWQSMSEFLAIPARPGVDRPDLSNPSTANRYHLFAANRSVNYYDRHWQEQAVIHFISKPGEGYRLLDHFYTYLFFEDEFMDRYFKRFVRDYVHYMDVIFCKAALIINQLLLESGGRYNAFHIRRGEFQYKVVKIPSAKILQNIKAVIPQKELVYVATDERNKTFFDAFQQYFVKVRYLDDFQDLADLKRVNPNYLGMIDQVICSRGERFVGTWFSTFSGYITRMRGYLGYSDRSVWYGDKGHRDRFQQPELPKFPFYMREWNNSWYQIDESS